MFPGSLRFKLDGESSADPEKPSSIDPSSSAAVSSRADEIDSSLDAALKDAGVEAEDESPKSSARGKDGKFKAKESGDAGDKPSDEADEATDGSEDGKPGKSERSDEDVRKAVAALQRYKVPKSVLKLAEQGDEETIAHGLHLAKIQSDSDAFSEKHKTLQQELESRKKPAANSGKGEAESASADSAGLDAAVKPLADYLAEALADDKAKERVRDSLSELVKGHKAELGKRDQQIAAILERVESAELDRARDAMMTEYPDLKDRQTWSRVKSQYDQLPISEARPDNATRLEHAVRIELAPELSKRAKEDREKKRKQRDEGSPSPADRAGDPVAVKSIDDLRDELIDVMASGDEARERSIKAEISRRLKKD